MNCASLIAADSPCLAFLSSDEVGFLPFLPDVNDCNSSVPTNSNSNGSNSSSIGSGSSRALPQYPYVVQEQGTKLGIPVFCWVPLLDESYRILKDAMRMESIEGRADSRSMPGPCQWWVDPGKTSAIDWNAELVHDCICLLQLLIGSSLWI